MAPISSNPLLPSLYNPSLPSSPPSHSPPTQFASISPMAHRPVEFEDFLPIMAEKLGEEGLMEELCNGFRLLMDPRRKLITFESLKRNAALLGLQGLGDDELRGMILEGDVDGDGALNEMEFCVLMVRLSPELMEEPRRWLDDAFQQVFAGGFTS
ncbi:Calcium-binding protein KIC [Ananas comosus]|uniref:Calcium-binding protein KIC n=2 Tax=Ananas comosus TaxID=4615 RepID=A0A199VLG4_ANACO|nr:Calcium-binding protein KIC [Ananas comosus]